MRPRNLAGLDDGEIAVIRTLVLVVVCAIALGAGIWLGRGTETPQLPEGVVLYDAPRTLGEFALQDKNGQAFTPDGLKGKWSLIYFGFTHCPDICPGSLAMMKRIRDAMPEASSPLQYMLVSIDPERDTPEILKNYVEFFDKQFLGVTGDLAAIETFSRRFGVAAIKVEDSSLPGGYTVDHTSVFALVNSDGNVAGLFPSPHKVDTVVAGVSAARKRYGS